MTSSATQTFLALAARLRPLVAAGHRENRDEILALLSRLSDDGVAMRHFIDLCATDLANADMYGTQSFVVYKCNDFIMRMNLWLPEADLPRQVSDRYAEYFSVDVFHNHNYDFFTVGVYGPGYYSEYYSTSQDISDLALGDEITFDRQWNMSLARGVTAFVLQDAEFHVQYAPEALSMSLNLIPTKIFAPDHKQYVLAKDRKTVSQVILPAPAANVTSLERVNYG